MLATLVGLAVDGLDNGLSDTPPRGWRSWNAFGCDGGPETILNDPHMRAQMRALLDKSRTVDGVPTSLAELGFNYVSMDDGWQSCNCSSKKAPNASLPQCPQKHGCFGGYCSFHDPKTGIPQIKPDRFPDMKAMIDYGHSLGLKVGSYLNNCICMEAGRSPTHYEQDAAWLTGLGFDEVKIDNCGTSHNIKYYAELFNKSGHPVRVENCHNFWPDFHTGDCPMNFFRSGGDIAPGIGSIIQEAYSTVDASDLNETRSRPGCWAYPDMSEIGNFADGPSQLDEERTHWSLWCIVSSPLVLGFDMNNTAKMERAWPVITNKAALAVSEAWGGHPGTLIKSFPTMEGDMQVTFGECDGSKNTLGWAFNDGKLVAPNPLGKASQQCLNEPRETACPPPTTYYTEGRCGLALSNCSETKKAGWSLNGTLVDFQGKSCLFAVPLNFDVTKGYYVRQSAAVKAMKCPDQPASPGKKLKDPRKEAIRQIWEKARTVPDSASFTLSDKGELKSARGECLRAEPTRGIELWAKPLGNNSVAILLVNPLGSSQKVSMPLSDVPSAFHGATEKQPPFACEKGSCVIRDIWSKEEKLAIADSIDLELRPYASAFYTLHAKAKAAVVLTV